MRKINFIILLSFLFFSCSSIKKNQFLQEPIINEDFSDFTFSVQNYLEKTGFQGSVLVAKKDKIIFAKGYGFSDTKNKNLPKNSIHSIYETGSITKQFTACSIILLEQKNKLSVDDKLSKYFPDYKYGDEITIKMLLNMTSGLTDHINSTEDFFPISIYRQIEKKQIENQPLDENIVLTYFYESPLLTTPNSTYFYCNTNYYLLAKIIEIVSGEKYEDFIAKNIFQKCGMNNSNFDFQKTTTKSYDYKGRYFSIPKSLSFGCGDLNSTVIDLFKWNYHFVNKKIVNKKQFKKMITTDSYGFGIYVKDGVYFHSGTTNVFNSYMSYDSNQKITIIVLSNTPISKINATFISMNINKMLKE